MPLRTRRRPRKPLPSLLVPSPIARMAAVRADRAAVVVDVVAETVAAVGVATIVAAVAATTTARN